MKQIVALGTGLLVVAATLLFGSGIVKFRTVQIKPI